MDAQMDEIGMGHGTNVVSGPESREGAVGRYALQARLMSQKRMTQGQSMPLYPPSASRPDWTPKRSLTHRTCREPSPEHPGGTATT
jgi:hypothetical protein